MVEVIALFLSIWVVTFGIFMRIYWMLFPLALAWWLLGGLGVADPVDWGWVWEASVRYWGYTALISLAVASVTMVFKHDNERGRSGS